MDRRRYRRVLLVTPSYHCGMVESAGVWMPLGLAYLAGALREAGFEPEIYDAMSYFHDDDDIARRIEEAQPDVVATTAYTATLEAALRVLRAARDVAPAALTVVGGVHPTHMAGEVLADAAVDVVVRGEGERSLPELLMCMNQGGDPARVAGVSFRLGGGVPGAMRARAGGDGEAPVVFHAPDRPFVADLDRLHVAWDLLDWPTYHYRTKPGSRLAITSWARGCGESCSFCSQRKLWRGSWRARDPEAVVAEARMLRTRFGVDTLEVADEHPTRDAARWEYILDRLIEEDLGIELLAETRADDIVRDAGILWKYRAAGVLHMYVGVESVRQDRLDAMRKNLSVEQSRLAISLLNEAGIITETSFLLGFPQDTRETVEETVRLSFEYAPDLAFFLAVTPWPYADWYREVADRVEVHDYSRYNLINPIIRPDGMTREELSGLLSSAFLRFYRDKMQRLAQLSEDKRTYMLRVAKLLMEESYLSREARETMAGLGHPAMAGHPGVAGAMPAGHPGAAGAIMPAGHPADPLSPPGVRAA